MGLAPGNGMETTTVMFPIEIFSMLEVCMVLAFKIQESDRLHVLDVTNGNRNICNSIPSLQVRSNSRESKSKNVRKIYVSQFC